MIWQNLESYKSFGYKNTVGRLSTYFRFENINFQ